MKLSEVKQLIREALLTERIFGKQAFVYHGSRMSPDKFLDMMAQDEFNPGQGAGAMYGKGLYTVYQQDPELNTFSGRYGNYVYKLKVNLDGFISFDREVSRMIYGKELPVAQQVAVLGKQRQISHRDAEYLVHDLRDVGLDEFVDDKYTSTIAVRTWEWLVPHVKGIVFTGRFDGPVAVIYDPASVVPVAWSRAKDIEWKKFDRESIAPAVKRSAMGQFKASRYRDRRWVDKDGELHRDGDKPALISTDGTKEWYQHGLLHRDGDKPAYISDKGTREWYQHNMLHRDGDKPAVINTSGLKAWYQRDQLHRDGDKPAYIGADGEQRWYQKGLLHRDDGPAKIKADGTEHWYRKGVELSGYEVAKLVPLEERNPSAASLIKNHGFRVLYDDTKDVFLKRDAGNVVVTFRNGEEKWFKDKKDYSEGEFVKSLGR